MRVTHVAVRPTEASNMANRPELTPELLAASGARYSRNNEGLDAILKNIDPENLDKSVESIFRMVDYGHQSIADMVPVAIFIDGISILLAYLVWGWCPTAGGQESSTRYVKLDREGLVDPNLFGIPTKMHAKWYNVMDRCFEAYGCALSYWTKIGQENPKLTRIPEVLLEDKSEKSRKQVARMQRNYAFDRARYFLPIATRTNMMLVMSARGWVQLVQNLYSHWLPEANLLAKKIREELALSAPRLVKHAEQKTSFRAGHYNELQRWIDIAKSQSECIGEASCNAEIEIYPPRGATEEDMINALSWHENRYDFIGSDVYRTLVRFSWTGIAMAELRDLNRHRTGQKYCPLVPVGFYHAADQTPINMPLDRSLSSFGSRITNTAKSYLKNGKCHFPAWILLGSQFYFEHATTLDKFIYEAELRSGLGAHYRYSAHVRDAVSKLARTKPKLASCITLGTGEPE